MARTIKKIAHDLSPLSGIITELSLIISQLLSAVTEHTKFDDPSAERYFNECVKASEKLAVSAKLIKNYITEVDNEADREGIKKD